jgi:hypothetical protein
MLDHSCQVQRHTLAERGDDAYMTPPCATLALLRHERLPHRLWEPCCGDGTGILDPLRAAGHEVIGSLIEQFIAHALELSPLVVVLARLALLESERRTAILEGRGLARIHVFRRRLPMMHRRGWTGRKANSGMAFCWMVWDRNHIGAPTIHRISWEAAA